MALAALEGKRNLYLERAKSAGSMLLRAMAGAALYASPIFIATLFTEPEPLPPFSATASPFALMLLLCFLFTPTFEMVNAYRKHRARVEFEQEQDRLSRGIILIKFQNSGCLTVLGYLFAPIAALLVIVLAYDVIAMASEAAALIFLVVVFCLPIIQVAYILVMLLLAALSTAASGKRA